jgi:non-ribosomal peptide synthetase component F
LLLEQVFELYNALSTGKDVQLPYSRPFHDYIQWLHRQSLQSAEVFWRRILGGFTSPIELGAERDRKPTRDVLYNEEPVHFSSKRAKSLQNLLRQNHLTLNTVMQGAWAILLSRYSGKSDVVFGTVVSGRAIDLPGIEKMVGMFINTLPIRVTVEYGIVVDWLRELQVLNFQVSQYQFVPLVNVHGYSEVPRGHQLFNSVVVVENYPLQRCLESIAKAECREPRVSGIFDIALTLVVDCEPDLSLKIVYDSRSFDSVFVGRLAQHLQVLLEGIVNNPFCRLSELSMMTVEERKELLGEVIQKEVDNGCHSGVA